MSVERVDTLQSYLHRVHGWRRASVNRRIFAAMVTVGFAGVLLKIVAMGKDVAVASYFGTSDAMDAFFIALALPTFALGVVAGSIPAALVPAYVRVKDREGEAAARRLTSTVLVAAVAALAVAAALLVVFAPLILPVIGATFTGEKLALTKRLFFLLSPAIVLSGISTIFAAILNAHERFALAAWTPAFAPVLTIALLFTAGQGLGIYALGIALLAGWALEVVVLGQSVRQRNLLSFPRWGDWHPEIRQVIGQYAPMVVGAAVMGSSPLIDQSMAASLGPGSVAELAFGSKIVAAALGVGTTALSTAIFPHFSGMVAAGNWAGARHTLRTYSRLILYVAIPTVALIVGFSDAIIRVLFERGEFSAASTHAVARVQALYALQIPFYVLGIIGVRMLSATGGNRILMWVSIGNFVSNIVGNLVFMRFWGVAGIALSTSVVYLVSAVVLHVCATRRLNRLASGQPGAL